MIIVDDIVSTGNTIIEAMRHLKPLKPKSIHCLSMHGVYRNNAVSRIKKAGCKTVLSTNSIKGKNCTIDISGLIAKKLR